MRSTPSANAHTPIHIPLTGVTGAFAQAFLNDLQEVVDPTMLLPFLFQSATPSFLLLGDQRRFFFNDSFLALAQPDINNLGRPLNELSLPAIEASVGQLSESVAQVNGFWPCASGNFTCMLQVMVHSNGAVPVLGTIQQSSRADIIGFAGDVPEFVRMVEQFPVGIAVFRGPLLIAELANEQYLSLIDRKRDQFLNKPLFESLPEVRPAIENILNDMFYTGKEFRASDFQVPLRRNERIEQAYFNFIYTPLRDANNEIDGFMVVVSEVTDSFLARHKLKESEAQFRKMVMESPIPMTIFKGPDHIVEMANRQMFENIWRRKEEDVIGKAIDDAFPELRNQKYMELLNRVYTEGILHTEKESVAFVEGNDGMQRFYLDFEYAPLKDLDGNIYGIMVTVNDVSDKVNAREAIAKSEQHFRSVADSAPVMIWISDESGLFDYFNTEALEFLGQDTNALSFDQWLSMIHPEERIAYSDAYKNALTNKQNFSAELRLRDHHNNYRWITSRSVVRVNEAGNFSGFIHAGTDIHERVAFNQALKEEEARRTIMLEASELGTWELDLQTNKVTCSPRFFKIFQLDENQSHTHREITTHIHPEDQDIRKDAFRKAFENGRLEYSVRIISPKGMIRWIEVKGIMLYDEKQEPSKLIGTLRDVTETRNYEQILKESERKFRMLADTMPQFVWTTDEQGRFTYFNKAAVEQTGLFETELAQRSHLHLQTHPEDQAEHLRKWYDALAHGTEFISEHRLPNKEGNYRWMLSRAIPQRNADNNIYLWVGTSTDIESHKMFEQELRRQVEERTAELNTLNAALQKSEARYHLMVNEVQEYAIIYMNKEGIIENWNKGAEQIKGYTAEEIIGKSFSAFYTDQDKARNLPQLLLAQATLSGKAQHEGVRVRKDGSLFWANVLITAIHDANKQVIGFSKVTRDLTKRKEADDQIRMQAELLQQKNEELEKMNAELQSFAYVSSHDLQEPLRKIQIFAGRIIEKELSNLSDKGRSYFERMQLSAARMQKLIQDLLIYSRTNNNEQAFSNCDLNQILQDVLKEFHETMSEKNISFEADELGILQAIPFQIYQLLHNLIGNSIKFMRRGTEGRICVRYRPVTSSDCPTVSLKPDKRYACLSVEDNGIGFNPEFSERIFEVFQRLHEKEEFSGTGIGLAIVKKIVDNHGGIIRAEGVQQKGARFDIYLPL